MKRIRILLFSALTACVALSGCAPSEASAPKETAAEISASPEPEAPITFYPKPRTVTTEMDAVTLLIHNGSDRTYSTDYVQKLEVSRDGNWQEVPLTTEAVSLALLVIPAGELMDYSFDFAYHYEPLEPGSYRITKTFVDDDGNAFVAYCEFDMF